MKLIEFSMSFCLVTILICSCKTDDGKIALEGCKNLSSPGLSFYMGLESDGENELLGVHEYNLELIFENTIQKEEKFSFYLFYEPNSGKRYRLYFSTPVLSLKTGDFYKINIIYSLTTLPYVNNRLKIYDQTGILIFANSLDMGIDNDFLKSDGILIEEVSGICPDLNEEGFENIRLSFSCGERNIVLFQGERGFLECNTHKYRIQVESAYWLPEGDPALPPVLSYYILKE